MDHRLKSKSVIESLFKEGKSIFVFPIKVVYIDKELQNGEHGLQIAVSVSKKYFKKAVDRNLIKRRIREAIRMSMIDEDMPVHYRAAMFIYIAHEIQDFDVIKKSVKKLTHKLLKT